MIRHIVAIDTKGGIAKNGKQPWKLPADEKYFADMTKQQGGIVLMGRTTFEAIGHPLKGRQNVVATRDRNYRADGVLVINDLAGLLDTQPDVWIIGGAQIYEATLDRADELYITRINADFSCDAFYPPYQQLFELDRAESPLEENGLRFVYEVYKRKHL